MEEIFRKALEFRWMEKQRQKRLRNGRQTTKTSPARKMVPIAKKPAILVQGELPGILWQTSEECLEFRTWLQDTLGSLQG